MSIKWRLTLSFVVFLTIAATITALFFFVTFRRWMIAEKIDGDLRVYSTLAALPLLTDNVDYGLATSTWTSVINSSPAASPVFIQLIDHDKNVVLKSENLGDEDLPTNNTLVDEALNGIGGDIDSVASADGTTLRIQVVPIRINGEMHLLEVAQSLAAVDPFLEPMAWTLFLGVLMLVGTGLIAASILVGRALSPVKKVTATAQGIASSSDLSRRVNYRGPKDEIGQLAATFDRMIEQLDKLLQSQRTFVADASHELRGPLTVIRGNLDLLKRNLSEEDRSESIRVLEAEMTRMTRIVNDLLVLAEVESGPLEQQQAVSLKEIILDAQDRALLIAGDRKIVIDRQEDLWVKGDGHKLDQMVSNLVTNAIKYTPDGGTITLSLYQDGDWARLDVTDTGIGISPEHLPHLFDRFYRVDKAHSRASGGTGLGLAIVRGIALQHGGKVTVTSEPGKGSTFSVWLQR